MTTCESESASTAWWVRGVEHDHREAELDLTDEQREDGDGEWQLPDDRALHITRPSGWPQPRGDDR